MAVIGQDTSLNSICMKPESASKTDRYCTPDRACRMLVCFGIGC